MKLIYALLASLAICVSPAAVVFYDDFDQDGQDPSWVVDRYPTTEFIVTEFSGDSRIMMNVTNGTASHNRPSTYSSTYYDFQGFKTSAVATLGQPWVMTVGIYMTDGMLTAQTPAQVGLGGQAGGGEVGIRFRAENLADTFNPDPAGITMLLETYAPTTNTWNAFDAGDWLDADTFNLFEVRGTSVGIEYYANGLLVDTVSVLGPLDLTEASLTVRNYGALINSPLPDIQYYLDDFKVETIPEPGIALLGCLGLFGIMRRRRAH